MFAIAAEHSKISLNDDHLNTLARIVALTQRTLPASRINLPNLPTVGPRPISAQDARNLAIRLREVLEMGPFEPLLNLPQILCNRFNILIFQNAPAPLAHGCAAIDRYGLIFLSGQMDPSEHLFICAHDLAHLLAFVRSRASDGCALHGNSTVLVKSPPEHFADPFAVDLLMPREGLKSAASAVRRLLKATNRSIGDVELLYLARIFGVPFLAVARGCERAGMLPSGSALTIDRFLTVKFGGAERRAQFLNLPDRPAVRIPPVPAPLETIIASVLNDPQ
jgi:Zn-dependent peptidase ImmA (M78 family)